MSSSVESDTREAGSHLDVGVEACDGAGEAGPSGPATALGSEDADASGDALGRDRGPEADDAATPGDPLVRHLVRHLGVWLGFQALLGAGAAFDAPGVTVVGVALAVVLAMKILPDVGYRRRDVPLLIVPVVSLVVGHRTVWRFTSRHRYWEARPARPNPLETWRWAVIGLGWVGSVALLAASAAPAPRSAPGGDADDPRLDAAGVVLRRGDLPSGWRAVEREAFADDDAMQEAEDLETLYEESSAAFASSPVFVRLTATATSDVWFERSEAQAENDFDILRDPEAGGTWEDAAADSAAMLPGNVRPVDVEVTEVPQYGDEALWVRFVFETVIGDEAVPMYNDRYFVRLGRIVAVVDLMDETDPFDADLAHELVTKVTERMAEAEHGRAQGRR